MRGLINCFTPDEIEKRSFEIIEEELAGRVPFSGPAWEVARRLVHATADFALLEAMHLPDEAVRAGVEAIRRGAPIYTDTEMVRMGIPERRLRSFGVKVTCLHAQPGVADYAKKHGITRSRAGVELAGERLAGSILAVGNAPTALLALMDYLDQAAGIPALVIAMPVGFVNAAESKELLLERSGLNCIAIRGRRGGSPLAAAAVNALAELALRR